MQSKLRLGRKGIFGFSLTAEIIIMIATLIVVLIIIDSYSGGIFDWVYKAFGKR